MVHPTHLVHDRPIGVAIYVVKQPICWRQTVSWEYTTDNRIETMTTKRDKRNLQKIKGIVAGHTALKSRHFWPGQRSLTKEETNTNTWLRGGYPEWYVLRDGQPFLYVGSAADPCDGLLEIRPRSFKTRGEWPLTQVWFRGYRPGGRRRSPVMPRSKLGVYQPTAIRHLGKPARVMEPRKYGLQ